MAKRENSLGLVKTGFTPFISGLRTTALLGCVDPRVQKAYIEFMRLKFGLDVGSYFANMHPGAVFDPTQSAIGEGIVKLLIQKGVTRLVIAPHTDCAADAQNHKFASAEEDWNFQLGKLERSIAQISDIAGGMNHSLRIVPAIMVIEGAQVQHFCGQQSQAMAGS